MQYATITSGSYRNEELEGTFPLIKEVTKGAKGFFVTVDATALLGPDRSNIRVKVPAPKYVEIIGDADEVEITTATEEGADPFANETDAEAIERIRGRFEILDQMTDAVASGLVKGLIVSGPPGVGKSHGVETILDSYEAMNKLAGLQPRTEVVKGSVTPIGLYQTLYSNRDKGNILVFDDCDSVLFDETSLNMLKAVLDSGKKRTISWKSESSALRREDIPDRFDFHGGVIFITNVNFENVRSKKIKDHLEALMSRCHYIDLQMGSERDRFLRIEQIVGDGMLDEYDFGKIGNDDIVEFMKDNGKKLREISLRMVLKVADLRAMDPGNWKNLARATCMRSH